MPNVAYPYVGVCVFLCSLEKVRREGGADSEFLQHADAHLRQDHAWIAINCNYIYLAAGAALDTHFKWIRHCAGKEQDCQGAQWNADEEKRQHES
jgi:hypothetical protein